ncbi:unnamed protein product [Heligmosomoides polygyrus]|uniref:Uncharacterized protein n=1 Tax=Heligmosomoides polygyrus TaxID=6339 RepID=A0A3P7XJB8_HELPZ|nr:unnamed protein product [Heligmosomoides polygyrus]
MVGFSIRTLNEVSFVANVIGSRGLTTGALVMLLVGVAALATTPLGIFSVTTSRQTTAFIVRETLLRLLPSSFQLKMPFFVKFLKSLTVKCAPQYSLQYSCCGVSFGKVAWTASQWFITYNHWPRPRVPESCCATCGDAQSRLGVVSLSPNAVKSFLQKFPQNLLDFPSDS